MNIANIYEAKTQLSKLINQAIAGEEVIIAKANIPVVKLVPYTKQQKPRKPGFWKGKVWVSDDFDEESEEINAMFYGQADNE